MKCSQAYGQTFIKDDFFLAMVGSLASIFNCGSRVLWGQVVDQVLSNCSLLNFIQQNLLSKYFEPSVACHGEADLKSSIFSY